MAFVRALISVLTITLRQVNAQSISDVPQCAEQAAFSSISSTGCQLTDIECICKDQSFINSLLPVVQNSCSPADLQKTIAFTESLCNTVGITISVPTSAPTTTSTGTSLPLATSSIVSQGQLATASGGSSNISTPTKTTAPTTASVIPSPESSVLRGNAARRYAQYAWAGTLVGTAVLLLL